MQVGFFWTLVVHLLLLLLAPMIFTDEFEPGRFVRPGSTAQSFDIEIMPESPVPSRFVETNPEAPDNVPDQTENFGAKNQQSAQPEPDKDSALRTPKTEGPEDVVNETQFMTGELAPPVESQPAPALPEQTPEESMPAETPQARQVPLPGSEKSEGDSTEAFGTNIARFPEPSTAAPERVEGEPDAQNPSPADRAASSGMRPQPQPRPRLAQVRPGILQNRPVGVSNTGSIAVDSKFSEFGDYLQELIETVQVQWDNILSASRVYPKPSTSVTVTFRLNSQGNISEIVRVDGDAGEYGTRACLSAIQARAPYRPWTKPMMDMLGNEQELTFHFHYW